MLKNLTYRFLLLTLLFSSCKKLEIKRIAKVNTDAVIIKNGYVTLGGTVVDIPEEGIQAYGHCYATHTLPKLSDIYTNNGVATEQIEFTSALASLNADAKYYFRAYVISGNDTIYGEEKSFSTEGITTVTISTATPVITGNTTSEVFGAIDGFVSVSGIDYGHCWSLNTMPTVNDEASHYGIISSKASFYSTITNMPLDKVYYVRSYVKLSDKTILYGNQESIVIPDLAVSTDSYTIPTTNNATLQGTVISLGIHPVTQHGHCWSSTTNNPNINNAKSSLGAIDTKSTFFSTLPNMQSGISYYYRAYAITGNQIKYGNVQKLTN